MVGDGSAMYTIQSLWTQARESLNVVTIVFANRIYQILRGEFDGVGAGAPGKRALDMVKIDTPALDFVGLAKSMGVAGRAVTTADELNVALAEAVAEPGPRVIEVRVWEIAVDKQSFRGDAKHRTMVCPCTPEKLEIPRCAIAHLRSGADAPSRNDEV